MKYFAVLFMLAALTFWAAGQTNKQVTSKSKSVSAKPKPTPAKAKAGQNSAPKSKTTASKSKPASKTTAKVGPSSKTSRKTTAKAPVIDDKAEFDAASAITDPEQRIAAFRKFIELRPESKLIDNARELLAKTEVDAGFERITASDLPGATLLLRASVDDVTQPMPEALFNDDLSKIPAALFWRGVREPAVEIAAALEGKAAANSNQLLKIADFYLNIESGAAAKRVANTVIALEPTSVNAYLSLALAERMDFQMDDSAAAFAKALELDPESDTARRGLAEMKRALSKPDEAAELYRQILAKDATSVPAETGLILSLFEAGKRTEAEDAMTKSLDANPGNVMLLAGAAYWYAAHNEAAKAILFSQKAIAADPRFIWSHIALARGYMADKKPLDAEQVLLAARRYGNFPTLEYEIASARAMAGYFREAAEELSKSFSVHDGVITTKLGGRITHESKDFTELLSYERRASIAAPVAADTPENAAELKSLLDLWEKLGSKDAGDNELSKAADDFVDGGDNMKFHRELFAAKELLERKKDLPKVLELSHGLIGHAETALDVPSPTAAVMADELYESRRLAVIRNEYIRAPEVPNSTLLNILRGRIEDINGRALFETDNKAEAVTRLKRAVSILPPGSSWWRTSSWRLGAAYEADGKGPEALDAYINSYKIGQPDAIKYSVIASLYRRLNGSLDGLDAKVGPNPAVAAEGQTVPVVPGTTVVDSSAATTVTDSKIPMPGQTPQPLPEPSPIDKKPEPAAAVSSPTPEPTPESSPESTPEEKPTETPTTNVPEPTPTATPEVKPSETPAAIIPEPSPSPTATPEVKPTATPTETVPEPSPTPEPSSEKVADQAATPSISPTPMPVNPEPTADKTTVPEPASTPTPEEKSLVTPQASPSPAERSVSQTDLKPSEVTKDTSAETKTEPSPSPTPDETLVAKTSEEPTATKTVVPVDQAPQKATTTLDSTSNGLFPPVVITIPQLPAKKKSSDTTEVPKPKPIEPKTDEKPAEVTPLSTTPDSAKPSVDTSTASGARPRIVAESATQSPPPCKLTLSETSLALQNSVGELAVIVGTDDDLDLTDVTATSSDPKFIEVRREPIAGIKGKALFVVRSISKETGTYTVNFALPCGRKELEVKVR